MERIYRGYPQALHAMERSGDLMPYMLYRREEQAGRRSAALEKRRFRDPEYFKGAVSPGPSDAARALWRRAVTGTITREAPFMMNTRTGYCCWGSGTGSSKRCGNRGRTQTRIWSGF